MKEGREEGMMEGRKKERKEGRRRMIDGGKEGGE